ncbi:MAG: ribosome small subunit-dependent GTPase A [Leptospira sp.]|nr:ribosome small subunit-dependent GTPase A [Leptospira sp.]
MPSNLSLFRISRIFGAFYEIYSPQHGSNLAQLKGNLRTATKNERHPFVVGDMVDAEYKGGQWIIHSKRERKSILHRKSSRKDAHALCANADYALVLASLAEPETKAGFIDRFLAAVSISDMEPVIVFTKKDLVSQEDILAKTNIYQELGYKIFIISMDDAKSFASLQEFISGKNIFLSGNSGVGKSTLVNLLTQTKSQPTNDVSGSTHKGKHTTTNSLALFLEDGTILIDSPGIKEWGILHLDPDELLLSFPELKKERENCDQEFCCEMDEDCPIVQRMDELTEERRKSLESMMDSLENPYRVTRRDHLGRSEK